DIINISSLAGELQGLNLGSLLPPKADPAAGGHIPIQRGDQHEGADDPSPGPGVTALGLGCGPPEAERPLPQRAGHRHHPDHLPGRGQGQEHHAGPGQADQEHAAGGAGCVSEE
ncbi:unnamed protein product, partial [Pipistrellus nathusii]